MTLKKAWTDGTEQLKEADIAEASLDAWYLLEYVTGISRASYYMEPEREMTQEEELRYSFYIKERKKRIPLQHLTGVQEFMGLEFLVNEHVLIPRQDTEVLVETAIEILESICKNSEGETDRRISPLPVLDMCTGSGCILLSLMHYLPKGAVVGTGVDISQKALETAKRNAEKLGKEAIFVQSNLFEKLDGKYQMIISNPPYIRTSVIEELQKEVREHDPYLALDGKEDGLYFYRKIIADAAKYLKKDGWLLFEIGSDQGEDVLRMMKEAGYDKAAVKKDLAGLDRVVFGVYHR